MAEMEEMLRQFVDLIDFTLPGDNASLGVDCLDRIVERAQERAIDEQSDAQGAYWVDNAEAYRRSPSKAGKPVGVLSGEMLSDLEMQGETVILPKSANRKYGKSTDSRDKASWFTRGSNGDGDGPVSGAKNQPPRPGLYELDDIAIDDVMQELNEFATRRLKALSRKP